MKYAWKMLNDHHWCLVYFKNYKKEERNDALWIWSWLPNPWCGSQGSPVLKVILKWCITNGNSHMNILNLRVKVRFIKCSDQKWHYLKENKGCVSGCVASGTHEKTKYNPGMLDWVVYPWAGRHIRHQNSFLWCHGTGFLQVCRLTFRLNDQEVNRSFILHVPTLTYKECELAHIWLVKEEPWHSIVLWQMLAQLQTFLLNDPCQVLRYTDTANSLNWLRGLNFFCTVLTILWLQLIHIL